MKVKDLKGKPIVALNEAAKIGSVDDVYIDLGEHRLFALEVNNGLFKRNEAMLATSIVNIGSDAITIAQTSDVNDVARFPELVNKIKFSELLKYKVVTTSGNVVGQVNDIIITDNIITGVEVSGGLWQSLTGRDYTLKSTNISSFGTNIIIITDEIANSLSKGGDTGSADESTSNPNLPTQSS